MQNNATKYVFSIGLCLSMLVSYTHIHAKDVKQSRFNAHKSSNATSGSFNDTMQEPDIPQVPQKFIDDAMHEYPDIALRVKMLCKEGAKDNYVPRTLLLHGKPGCGKTTMAVAIARSLKRKIAYFESLSLVGDKYQNSGIKRLEKTLEKIVDDINKNPKVKYVVVIDEIMRLVENYKDDRGEAKNVATKFWLIMDKFKHSGRVFFIATANEIDDLPEQVEYRFCRDDMIEITLPGPEFRREILLNCLNEQHKLAEKELNTLVDYTDGLTHRDIEMIVLSAARISFAKDEKNENITFAALEEAIGKVKDLSFVARWVYGPINNWFVKPVIVKPINSGLIKPFNKFCKNNKETLDNAHKVLGILGFAKSLLGESSSSGKVAQKTQPENQE